jgi:hypothetical protein
MTTPHGTYTHGHDDSVLPVLVRGEVQCRG